MCRRSFRIFLLLSALMFWSSARPQVGSARWEFGFSMATGMNSQLYSCFLVKVFDGRVIEKENITAEQFVLQAKGLMKSKANPEGADIFQACGIALCSAEQTATAQEQIDDCDPFAQVWRLRFQEWPFKDASGLAREGGWAEATFGPSERQALLLQEFGMRHFLDVIHGADAFNLLKSMRDEGWIQNYRQGL